MNECKPLVDGAEVEVTVVCDKNSLPEVGQNILMPSPPHQPP